MPRRLALLLPLALLAGCAPSGGGGGVDTGKYQGDAKQVAQVLDDLTDAARRKDGQRACAELLVKEIVDTLEKRGGCAKALDDQFDDIDVATIDVDDIRVIGENARARVRSEYNGDKVARTVLLTREANRWRIEGVER